MGALWGDLQGRGGTSEKPGRLSIGEILRWERGGHYRIEGTAGTKPMRSK